MARRGGLTKADKRRGRQVAAHRRVGAKYTYYPELWELIAGPIVKLVVLLAAVAGLLWTWFHVPHLLLGVAAIVAALGVAAGWWVWTGSVKATQARMAANARSGGQRRGAGLGWAVTAVCVILLGVSWLSLGSQWA